MKRLLKSSCIVLLAALFFVLAGCSSEPDVKADYDTVHDAVAAYKGGTDITGKKIKVKASMDSAAGVIYSIPDMEVRANVTVTIITNDSNRNEVLSIKEDDIVVVKAEMVDNHLVNSVYIFATEYQLVK